MNEAQVLDNILLSFSSNYLTKDKLKNVFCSKKADDLNFPANTLDLLNKLLMNTQLSLLDNGVRDSIYKLLKIIRIKKEKPNFTLCSIVARKLGFNVNSKGTNLLIRIILYIYENNIDEYDFDEICEILSQKHNITQKNIKWNIENSLKSMKRYSEPQLLHIIYSKYDGRPLTIRYIIILSVYELRKNFHPEKYNKERIEKILYSI